jgi:hypothetical protein
MRARAIVFAAAALWAFGAPCQAQAPTGIISGHVVSADGQSLPGVTVSVMGSALQGTRTAISSDAGDYLVTLLPPGDYTVSFVIGAFQTVREVRRIAGTQTAMLNVTMAPASVTESVTVVGSAQPFLDTAQVATNFKQDLMAALPSNRTLDAVMLMAPAVHATGPKGAFSIAGSQSYENLYTLNGAVIVENLRGSAYPLYIEDAIQEVTVATAGVSAEYGRFAGGMVSAVTKSGGNFFSGSFRTSLANDYWRSLTPAANDPKRDPSTPHPATNPMYEATFGGPLKKERLWFFGATRIKSEETADLCGSPESFAPGLVHQDRPDPDKFHVAERDGPCESGDPASAVRFAVTQIQRRDPAESFARGAVLEPPSDPGQRRADAGSHCRHPAR